MELPVSLKLAIDNQVGTAKHTDLVKDAQNLSLRYRNESGHGKRLLTSVSEALAYSIVRMPATYGAVYQALGYTLDLVDCDIESIIDVGAGTGAASWAADSLLDLKSIICLERESSMRKIGQSLMQGGSKALNDAKWIDYNITKDTISQKADIVIASYVLNELGEDERIKAIDKLWSATDKILLIVEPGTKVGYNQLKKIREYLLAKGGHIVAPCSHNHNCELKEDDWCHFTCRVQRSKMHKQIKDVDVPYEDEKFTYIAVSRSQYKNAEARILRHPIIEKGKITLDVCSANGVEKLNIYKKDGELYKKAKKSQCGDEVNL